ncbi:GGDEF domain-containing protein [Rugamonas sp.]|uniref:sensor domain-containing diguanylate cyclase n=1 Tax=Rugamonas sp. TaxID=1926287 RepID=UPI0025E8FE03|nr:GGDEF domain-containing protein [Rugamonas sp.]
MPKRLSITFWATTFVIVVCASLVAIDGWRSWNARVQRLVDMERVTSNLARAMAQQADDTIKAADTSLTDIVERLETDGYGDAAVARLHRLMVEQAVNLPQLSGLFAYDETGRWLVNSRPEAQQPLLNNADREYFIYHQTHAGRGPHIGVPVRSRSTGQWIIPVSRRLNHADGRFGGVALATIDVDYFHRFYQSFDIGRHGAVALFSNDGVMLLRRPFNPDAVGASVRKSPVYLHYLAHNSGSDFFRSGQDGQLRFNSYLPLQHYPLFVTAALSKDEMLAEWRRDTWLHTLGVLLLALLLGLFGKRLVDQIRLRVRAEAELLQTRDALERLNSTLERQAMQDGLTGLANRRQLDVTLGNEFSRAMRHGEPLAFVMIDVDYFKQYNDRYGHGAGDDCLRALSTLIRTLTPKRPGDVTARYGGEELAVLLPHTDVDGAHAVAERIRAAIEALAMPHSGSPLGVVTVSAGVATIVPQRGVHLEGMLVAAADKALYAAKSAGRNRVCVAAEAALHS